MGKYPPLQGGVSADTWDAARELALRGYRVDVVTNCGQTPPEYRQVIVTGDLRFMEPTTGTGRVRVHSATAVREAAYVPWAQPFVSTLLGRTLSVIEQRQSGVIVGWYLEPYGVVAALAARITGLPLLLKHGGSDLGRLAEHPDLRSTYRWALAGATAVATTDNARDHVLALGVPPQRVITTPRGRSPRHLFRRAPLLDLGLYARSVDGWLREIGVPDDVAAETAERSRAGLDPALQTIGLYGKVADAKGSFDFLSAVSRLGATGVRCNVVAAIGGDRRAVRRFVSAAHRRSPADGATVIVPFLPPWRIPEFLGLCDIAAYLERDFPISLHRSSVPTEVLLSGTCLLISSDALRQQAFADDAIDNRSIGLVLDPRDHSTVADRMATLLGNPDLTRDVGFRGRALMRALEASLSHLQSDADTIDEFAQPHLSPARHFSLGSEPTGPGQTSVGARSQKTSS